MFMGSWLKVQDLEARSKVTTRWCTAMSSLRAWARMGAHMVREIMRLVQEETLDAKYMGAYTGLPWQLKAEATRGGISLFQHGFEEFPPTPR